MSQQKTDVPKDLGVVQQLENRAKVLETQLANVQRERDEAKAAQAAAEQLLAEKPAAFASDSGLTQVDLEELSLYVAHTIDAYRLDHLFRVVSAKQGIESCRRVAEYVSRMKPRLSHGASEHMKRIEASFRVYEATGRKPPMMHLPTYTEYKP